MKKKNKKQKKQKQKKKTINNNNNNNKKQMAEWRSEARTRENHRQDHEGPDCRHC